MPNLLLNRWFQVGATAILAVVVGVVIGVLLAGSGSVDSVRDVAGTVASGEFTDETGIGGLVSLRTGGGIQPRGESVRQVAPPLGQDFAIELPLTAAEAVAAGWIDPVLCRVGRGRYFQKGPEGEAEPYFLMYNSLDRLIGVYLFSDVEILPPWEQMDSLSGGGGLTLIDFPHWGLFVYFQDSTRACRTTEIEAGGGDPWGGQRTQVKSTPTAVVPPTPTPTAGLALESVVARTARVKSLSFTLTGDPEAKKVEGTLGSKGTLTLVKEGIVTVTDSAGTALELGADSLTFSFEGLGATLSAIAGALQEPVDTKAAFIDNLRRRGVSGTVLGSHLSALVPTAIPDARVAVSVWFDDKDRIVRLRIEGKVTPDDPPDTVRVLDVGGFRG